MLALIAALRDSAVAMASPGLVGTPVLNGAISGIEAGGASPTMRW